MMNSMPIRVHVSQLSDEELLAKLGVKRRAKPRELERPHQVALIKCVRTVKDTHSVLKLLYAVLYGGDRRLRAQKLSPLSAHHFLFLETERTAIARLN
jgi:hypothetical protein